MGWISMSEICMKGITWLANTGIEATVEASSNHWEDAKKCEVKTVYGNSHKGNHTGNVAWTHIHR